MPTIYRLLTSMKPFFLVCMCSEVIFRDAIDNSMTDDQ